MVSYQWREVEKQPQCPITLGILRLMQGQKGVDRIQTGIASIRGQLASFSEITEIDNGQSM